MWTRGQLYIALYAVTSTALFAASLVDLCSRSYDFMTLVQELTYDVRLLVLLNFIVCFYLVWMLVSIRVFFGEIRIIEMEHIADRIPFSMLTLLFLLLDDDNLILDWIWFGLTLCMKVYHTILYDRIDYLQVKIVNRLSESVSAGGADTSRWGVLKMYIGEVSVMLLLLLMVLDVVMAKILAYDVFQGLSAIESLLFGIQFGVMGIESYTYLGKLSLNVYEMLFYRMCFEPTRLVPVAASTSVDHGGLSADVIEQPPSELVELSDSVESSEIAIDSVASEIIESNNSCAGADAGNDDSLVEENATLPSVSNPLDFEDDDDDDDEDDDDERVWENKSFFVQTFTIFLSTLKASFYMVFLYMLSFHLNLALPGTIIQGCITSVYQLCKQIVLFRQFLSHSRRLDNHLATASESELSDVDHMCIICRENMHCPAKYERTRSKPLNQRKYPKKLRCGHILHMSCLKDWLERSDSCPLCRKKVFGEVAPLNNSAAPPSEPAPVDRPNPPQVVVTSMQLPPAPTPTTTTNVANIMPETANMANAANASYESSISHPISTSDATMNRDFSMLDGNQVMGSSASLEHSVAAIGTTEGLVGQGSYSSGSNVHVPRDWVCLPLERKSSSSYLVRLNESCVGNVLVNRHTVL